MKRTLCLFTIMLAFSCGESRVAQKPISLAGVVDYDGALDGTLEVSVFRSFPPRGGPIAVKRVETPTFPYRYAFTDLPPGRYYVLAMIDRNADDGGAFHPTIDPGGAHGGFTSPVSVLVGATVKADAVDLRMVDPSPKSPWIRRNYR